MPVEIDAQRLIRSFEGPTHLHRRLVNDGYDVNIKTIERWIARRSIPGGWLLILSAYAAQDGRQLHIHDYIVSTEDIRRLGLNNRDFLT